MSSLVGSFGARKTEEEFVPEMTWTKVVCDQVLWNVANRYGPSRGAFVGKEMWSCTFVAGAALRYDLAISGHDVRLMVYQNGEPRARLDSGERLARLGAPHRFEMPLSWRRPGIAMSSGRNEREEDEAGEMPAAGEIQCRGEDVFELYVWHDIPEGAVLTPFRSNTQTEGAFPASVHFAGVYHH